MVSPPTHQDSNWPLVPDAQVLQPGNLLLLDKRPAGFGRHTRTRSTGEELHAPNPVPEGRGTHL